MVKRRVSPRTYYKQIPFRIQKVRIKSKIKLIAQFLIWCLKTVASFLVRNEDGESRTTRQGATPKTAPLSIIEKSKTSEIHHCLSAFNIYLIISHFHHPCNISTFVNWRRILGPCTHAPFTNDDNHQTNSAKIYIFWCHQSYIFSLVAYN